jgi:hypothetical protein
MINTVLIKQQQLHQGYFAIGSGPEKMLIMGSCRVCPLVEYFRIWNEKNDNRFTIYSIDPFNFNWNVNDDRVDYDAALQKQESNQKLLDVLKSVDYFFHEYYQNGGMFNTFKDDLHNRKTIYHFGLNPKVDICLPNYNDVFVLFGDIVTFDIEMRKKAMQDYNVTGKLSEQTQREIFEISQRNLEKFYEVCRKSDMPKMEEFFRQKFTSKRLFWTYNHVSKEFTFAIFIELLYRLALEPSPQVLNEAFKEDMFANNYTYLTEYDIKWYGYEWNEEIKPLRDKL